MQHIKNPLTIIGIFAGIAEISGTAVVSHLLPTQQSIFVWFLIGFPTLLVLLFFLTLNFNHRVLYAPSDFSDESNFLRVNRYDVVTQQNVSLIASSESREAVHNVLSTESSEDEIRSNIALISNFKGADDLAEALKKMGYSAAIYLSDANAPAYDSFEKHEAIWLGYRVPARDAIKIIQTAKASFPHLKYIHLSDRESEVPNEVHDQIFIGGSTSTAAEYRLVPLSEKDFASLQPNWTKSQLHDFVRTFENKRAVW